MFDSKELFNGHGVRVTLDTADLPGGGTKTSARLHRPDVVHIIAINSDGNVLLLREYRPFYGEYIWMLPSGHVDKESDALEAAHRELREETGFRAQSLTHFVTAQTAEKLVTKNHIYIGKDLVPDPLPQDAYERIEVHSFPIDEALKLVQSSPNIHMPSAYGLLLYLSKLSDTKR